MEHSPSGQSVIGDAVAFTIYREKWAFHGPKQMLQLQLYQGGKVDSVLFQLDDNHFFSLFSELLVRYRGFLLLYQRPGCTEFTTEKLHECMEILVLLPRTDIFSGGTIATKSYMFLFPRKD